VSLHRKNGKIAGLVAPFLLLGGLVCVGAATDQAGSPGSWLDRPLVGWNTAGLALPKAAAAAESRDDLMKRCQLAPLQSTSAERALAAAGWIPFHNLDQALVRDEVEIVGGMTGADGMCRPETYNLFVFVRDRFAGTLSPTAMNSRTDGSSGAVRIIAGDTITTAFSRYQQADALCCPSSHVSVRYRIDRSGPQPIVVPTELQLRP
jgi:hypothetical protein